jgi:hypothetical protein
MSYQRFNRADDIIENQKTTITSGMWTGGSTRLTSNFCTSSAQGASSASYIDSYQTASTSADAEVQFAVGYANIDGKGSIGNTSDTNDGNRETKAMYSQFLNLLTAPNTSNITFAGTGGSTTDFYFVSVQRARMREKMNAGNWELRVSGSGTGAKIIKLIDDSSTSSGSISQGGRVYNVVTGSLAGEGPGGSNVSKSAANESVSGGAGLFYPDLGLILLNPNYVSESAGASLIPARSTNTFDNTPQQIFTAISGAEYFQARREEEISSTSYFCRVNNKRFNFSTNPTFFTSSDGSLTQTSFFKDPQTFITQVGLYNEANELLAIAKLSQPLLNSYAREAIIKVKLDF